MKILSYEKLKEIKRINKEFINYTDKLNTTEWHNKRQIIISRDKNICTNCKKLPTIYFLGKNVRVNTPEEQEIYIKDINQRFRNSVIEDLKPYTGNLVPDILKTINIGKQILNEPTILHVHHKYYINRKEPWQYNDNALITLCQDCHQNIHDLNDIPVYSDEKLIEKLTLTKCSKCNGSGYVPEYHYHHNGICFRCNGNKYDELIDS